MFYYISVLLVIILINCKNVWSSCSDNYFKNIQYARIIGGEDASIGEFPYLVSIRCLTKRNLSHKGHFCGGIIIDKHWVLSAAHCIKSKHSDLRVSNYNIVAGIVDFTRNETGQVREASEHYIHPKYDKGSQDNDIILIKLKEPFDFDNSGEKINKIQLPKLNLEFKGDATAMGWGKTTIPKNETILAFNLQKVMLKLISTKDCKKIFRNHHNIIDSHICTEPNTEKDACAGDSGGPLICVSGRSTYVCGIVSFGIECAHPEFPGVYTKVSIYTKWIRSVMKPGQDRHSNNEENIRKINKFLFLFNIIAIILCVQKLNIYLN